MNNQTFDLKAEAKEHIIKDISKIYYLTYKNYPYADVLQAFKYNARTNKGFNSLMKMAEKLGESSKNVYVQDYYKNIQILKVLLRE